MRANEEGLELTRAELTAAIAAASPASHTLNAVAFEAGITTVRMYASDGRIAVQATGDNEGLQEGRWRVLLEFLDSVKKTMGSKSLCRLRFSGASLHEAVILERVDDDDGKNPTLEESATITWHADAVDHQQQFPFDELADHFRGMANDRGVPAPVVPRYYEVLALVGKCGIRTFDRCPGRRRHDSPVFDVAKAYNGTDWVCLSMPLKEGEAPKQGELFGLVERIQKIGQKLGGNVTFESTPANEATDTELNQALNTIRDPDGTGTTKVSQKGFGSKEFEQIGGPGYVPHSSRAGEHLEQMGAELAHVPPKKKTKKKKTGEAGKPKRRKGVRSPEDVEREASS